MSVIFKILMFLCAWTAGLATPASIIYFLYNWGGLDIEAGKAAWSGAKLWMWMFGGGFIGIFSCAVLSILFKTKERKRGNLESLRNHVGRNR